MEVWTCAIWYKNVKKNFEKRLTDKKEQAFHLTFKESNSWINEGMGITLTELREYMSLLDKDPKPLTSRTTM